MTKPEAPEPSLVARVLHPNSADTRQGPTIHKGHPFVAGMGTSHATGRGTGGWILLDDPAFEAHVCVVCGRPEADPVHSAEPPED